MAKKIAFILLYGVIGLPLSLLGHLYQFLANCISTGRWRQRQFFEAGVNAAHDDRERLADEALKASIAAHLAKEDAESQAQNVPLDHIISDEEMEKLLAEANGEPAAAAPAPAYGGRGMTMRECMEAEERGSAPTSEDEKLADAEMVLHRAYAYADAYQDFRQVIDNSLASHERKAVVDGHRREAREKLKEAINALANAGQHPGHTEDEVEALRDMLSDARMELTIVREALGVSYEPHQTVQERTIEAARALAAPTAPAPTEPWRAHVEQRIRTWRQRTMNKSGDRLAIDDFMEQDSIDDLVDFVCDEYATPPSAVEAAQPEAVNSASDPMRAHVEEFATKGGWVASSGEGAFEFVQRTSYHQGWQDGRKEGRGDTHRDGADVNRDDIMDISLRAAPADYDWLPEAREIAAQCWCDDETKHLEMDAVLFEAVAKRIAVWMRTGAQHANNEGYWRGRARGAEEKAFSDGFDIGRADAQGEAARALGAPVASDANSPTSPTTT